MSDLAKDATMIAVSKVSKRFGDFVAVSDLTMSVNRGEIVALLGKTGAGKSTVLSLVMGTLKPDVGNITVAGRNPYTESRSLRGKMSVSFQTDRLLPWRTAVENVEVGLLINRMPRGEARATALKWLDRVKLSGAANKFVQELSGGMRQRVSLARALAVDPDLILLDESFSQLDHVTSKILREDVSAIIREFGKTCLFITHRIEDAIEVSDRLIVLAPPAQVRFQSDVNDVVRNDSQKTDELKRAVAFAMEEMDVSNSNPTHGAYHAV